MIWVVIVLCVIIAAILCFLATKMKIIIEYRNGKTTVVFKSMLLRFTLDEKRMERFSGKSVSKKKSKKSEDSDKNKKSEKMTAEGFFEKLEKIKETCLNVKDVVVSVLGYLGPRTEISDIRVNSTFGTGDAAKTGMICGAVWSLSGVVYGFLCRFFNIEYPQIELDPVFDQKCFEIEAGGIIKIRPVHIITAAIRGFKVYDKHKNKKGV